MPNLLMCRNCDCDKRHECVRYRALPSVWQQWMLETPEASSCRHFLPIKGRYPVVSTSEMDQRHKRKK